MRGKRVATPDLWRLLRLTAASSGAVKAPMDGAIVDVLVAEGGSRDPAKVPPPAVRPAPKCGPAKA